MNIETKGQPSAATTLDFLLGDGETAALMRAHDWSASPLGAPDTWPQSLRSVVGLMLGSKFPMFVAWGRELGFLYNDPYAEILGAKHPAALGARFHDIWAEIWPDISPLIDAAMAGEAIYRENLPLVLNRKGFNEQAWFTFSYSPVRDESGQVAGMFCAVAETTAQVLSQRRQSFRLSLEERLAGEREPRRVMDAAVEALGRHLGASRVGYSEVRADRETIDLRSCFADGVAPVFGTRRLDDFGPASIAKQRRGETEVVSDVRAVPSQVQDTWKAIDTRAFVSVPLIRNGLFCASLYVNRREPHAWTADEVRLIKEVAARTWDAVERERAEAGLREREARLRAVVENVHDYAIFTTDAQGLIETWPPGAAAVFGWSAAEAIGRPVDMTYTPEDREAGTPERERRKARATGEAANVRWHLRRDGSCVFIEGMCRPLAGPDGTVAGFVKVGQDMTERRAREEALRDSEARLRALTDNLPSGMVYQIATGRDGRERRFLYVSQSHEKLTGVPAEAVLADPSVPYDLIVPEHRAALAQAEADAIRERRPFDVQAQFRRMDGQVRWCRIISVPREQPDGTLIWDGLQIDIEEQKTAEARLRELNETLEARVAERTAELAQAEEALRQSQKLEAMGQLTGGVAHDFNNLLTPIVGGLDRLQRKGLGDERDQRLVEGALQSAERARTLVQRLLAFARRQPLQPGPVDVGALVAGMGELIASTSGPRVRVELDVAPGLPPARADANQLEMALLNLAVNARDAMPEGGTLTIAAAPDEVDPRHRSKLAPGAYVRLSIADTGIGMTKEVLARAIEPFFSTKGIGKSTGLGLSMVHGLAAQLGGALAIASRPGLGTSVELWLPASEGVAPSAERGEASAAQGGAGTALLVDDEELVRASTADMLVDMGYSVVEAGSAEEALRLLNEGLAPDVLVTDHLMPGLTGTELAREVRRRQPGLPVLVMSGYAEVEGIAPDLPRLAKPFRQGDLVASLTGLGTDGPA